MVELTYRASNCGMNSKCHLRRKHKLFSKLYQITFKANSEINPCLAKHEDIHSKHGSDKRQTYNIRKTHHHQELTQESL